MAMRIISALAAIVTALWLGSAAAEEMPSPLGIPLGTSIGEVRKALGRTPMTEDGLSKYTRKPMYVAPGSGLGVFGLRQVRFVFDKGERLVLLIMTLDGDRTYQAFDRVSGHLSRYAVKSRESAGAGHRRTVYETRDALIELETEGLGANVTASYITKEAYELFMSIDRAEEATRKTEAGRF